MRLSVRLHRFHPMFGSGGARSAAGTALFVAWCALGAAANACVAYWVLFPYDLMITGVRLHDGTGAASFMASVAIRDDRLAAVWRGEPSAFAPRSRVTVKGNGLDLAPGFIDTHSHADQSLRPGSALRVENLVEQGVTTAIVGNCGRSLSPVGRLAAAIEQHGASLNVATLVGYNTVRSAVMGDSVEPAAPAQIEAICERVREGMDAGALGLSTGMPYVPGRFASSEELVAALLTAAKSGGLHASHVRDEGSGVIAAIHEVAALSAAAGVRLVVSHLKIIGPSNCSQFGELLRTIGDENDRLAGRLYFDEYPYAASSTNLDIYLPDWFLASATPERDRVLGTEVLRTRLKQDIKERLTLEGFTDLDFVRIASATSRRDWEGRSIAGVDRAIHSGASTIDSQLDIFLDLVRRGGAQVVYGNICRDVMEAIPRSLPVMVGTDSAVRVDGEGTPHPRGWGTFPRIYSEFVRRKGLLTVDEAVQRMTALPASVFGLARRGIVRAGYSADLVLFDANTIRDTATYANPFGRPVGVELVWVNGRVVAGSWRAAVSRVDPALVSRLPGKLLRGEAHATRPLALQMRRLVPRIPGPAVGDIGDIGRD